MPFLSTLALSLAMAAQGAAAPQKPEPTLKVGDPAPPLAISKWVKGSPVEKIEKDGTYVVEFWATWCGPCLDTIPHLTELAKENPDIKFVGVSIWETDQKLVDPFVTKMGGRMEYSIGMDKVPSDANRGRDGDMAKNWMTAAQAPGIPTAFIVKEGTIQWMGHPFLMDKPLAFVKNNDKQALAKFISDQAMADKLIEGAGAKMEAKDVDGAMKDVMEAYKLGNPWALFYLHSLQSDKGDKAGADETLKQMLTLPGVKNQAQFMHFMMLLGDKKFSEATEVARTAFAELGDHPMMVNYAWALIDPANELENPDVDLALAIAEKSIGWKSTYVNNRALARAWYLKGDKAKAAEFQKQAIALAPDRMKEQLTKTLKEYEATK
jgi:thiol-disulfide isomerase/thioredoxin